MYQIAETATITTAAKQFHLWGGLPDELQLCILRQYLTKRAPISTRMHMQIYAPLLAKIARVSKKMREMAYEVYYGENTFIFAKAMIDATCAKVFRFPTSQMGHLLRRVELRVYIPTSLHLFDQRLKVFCRKEDDSLMPMGLAPEIHTLVRSRRAQFSHVLRSWLDGGETIEEALYWDDTLNNPLLLGGGQEPAFTEVQVWSNKRDRHTTWQKHLTCLNELKIFITVDGCLKECARKAFQELPEYTETFLRARNVRVDVTVPGCADRSTPSNEFVQPLCDGQCAKLLQDIFEGMIKH